jgi:urease accessory protein
MVQGLEGTTAVVDAPFDPEGGAFGHGGGHHHHHHDHD